MKITKKCLLEQCLLQFKHIEEIFKGEELQSTSSLIKEINEK